MPVIRRHVAALKVSGVPALGAAGDTALFPSGTDAEALAASLGPNALLRQIGRGILAEGVGHHGAEPEPGHLAGRNVMLAFRRAETPEAVRDWLTANAARGGADAALIVVMGTPAEADAFACELGDHDWPMLVVSFDAALCRPGAPDMSDPATAPAARTDREARTSDRTGPLEEIGVVELLRRRFLGETRAVATLEIADTLICKREASPFDAAAEMTGAQVPLHGIEAYPWRLRKGAPAAHLDHVAVRLNEKRWISGWCARLQGLPDGALIRPGAIIGVPVAERCRVRVSRAIGVVYPAAPVRDIVRRADLVEDAERLEVMREVFGTEPIRSKRGVTAPARSAARDVTVVTAMKDEGPFIVDWVAHLRTIGVTRILAYTNDCSDGTERLLDALAPAGVVRRDNPYRETGGVPQHAAFRAAEEEAAVRDASWLLTLDVDEYPNLHAGDGTLPALIDAADAPDLISLPWRLFGNGDRERFDPRPVTEQFRLAAPRYAPRPLQAWGFKTLYRNNGLFRRLGVHRPRGLNVRQAADLRWADGAGRPMPPYTWTHGWRMTQESWGYDLGQINHYAVRSAESFLVKRARGRVNHTSRGQGPAYWFRMNHNQEEDTSISRYAAPAAEARAALMALPGVPELHEAAVTWHRERIEELRQSDAAFLDLITSDRMKRLSRLTTHFGMRVFLEGPHVIPDEIAARDPGDDFFFTIDGEADDGTGADASRLVASPQGD